VELLLRAQRHEESHPELFTLVREVFSTLNVSKDKASVWPTLFAFYLRYISFAGFAMKFSGSTDPASSSYFDIDAGEEIEIHGAYSAQSQMLHKLTPEMLAALRHLSRTEVQHVSNLRLSENARHGLANLFRSYFHAHIEGMQQHKPKSGKVFSAMKK